MLTQAQKKELKAKANKLENKYQIGKNGLGPTNIDLIKKALEAHELIKVFVLKTAEDDINILAERLSGACNAEVVQVVGRVLTLYKKSNKVGFKHVL